MVWWDQISVLKLYWNFCIITLFTWRSTCTVLCLSMECINHHMQACNEAAIKSCDEFSVITVTLLSYRYNFRCNVAVQSVWLDNRKLQTCCTDIVLRNEWEMYYFKMAQIHCFHALLFVSYQVSARCKLQHKDKRSQRTFCYCICSVSIILLQRTASSSLVSSLPRRRHRSQWLARMSTSHYLVSPVTIWSKSISRSLGVSWFTCRACTATELVCSRPMLCFGLSLLQADSMCWKRILLNRDSRMLLA